MNRPELDRCTGRHFKSACQNILKLNALIFLKIGEKLWEKKLGGVIARKSNIFQSIWNKIKIMFSKKKILPEPQVFHYDEGVNIVVMKKDNFENLKVNVEKMNKKVKLDNGFISVDDLSDEEIEDMIQLYNDELKEVNKRLSAKKLELERLNQKEGQ